MCYISRMLKHAALAALLLLSSLSFAQDSTTARPIPNRKQCRTRALASNWGKTLARIPSTVVDVGVLRNIPYFSFRAGEYEMNVYGDPDAPCCIEVGIHKELLTDKTAQKNCIDFITSLFPHAKDRELIAALDLKKDLKVRKGLTFEITPPDSKGRLRRMVDLGL